MAAFSTRDMTLLKGDDSCSVTGGDWADNVEAWQYDAIHWLGLTGLLVAFVVVASAFLLPRLSLSLLGFHVGDSGRRSAGPETSADLRHAHRGCGAAVGVRAAAER